jgi:hypothetical protein
VVQFSIAYTSFSKQMSVEEYLGKEEKRERERERVA